MRELLPSGRSRDRANPVAISMRQIALAHRDWQIKRADPSRQDRDDARAIELTPDQIHDLLSFLKTVE
jgi:hypothetical protein